MLVVNPTTQVSCDLARMVSNTC